MQDFEKLGLFYLGRAYDLDSKKPKEDLLLYDARHLTTHAVCVGMTGSGKTGLCIGLIEEAAIDGIPSIVIDPKGDLANLLLTFPDLRPEDFRPWINEDDARRKGLAPDAYASQQAELWRAGLAEWGQDGDRIRRLRAAADAVVYTPGSTAGLPVSVLGSLASPPRAVLEDAEALREQVTAASTGLLGLLGIAADPLQSREHILLSAILGAAWKEGHDLDLAALIQRIQTPPMSRVGVLELESFYPAKDRFGLAMAVNGLLASPGFEAWMQGEPLDIDRVLHGPDGRPRIAIFSIAHLGDAERMFFVSFLLNRTIGWMRAQTGTTSLRALLYMDEIFGYFPPVANPPSKTPLLTLLKQARAFGLGVVLATQNPVDLDYKGLANAGTWFLGRLQTERDKMRVLDGLEGAAAGAGATFDRRAMEEVLAGLGSRVFLMNDVHDDAPVVFQTRWTLSYLRGPLSRGQIRDLTASRPAEGAGRTDARASGAAAAGTQVEDIPGRTSDGDASEQTPAGPGPRRVRADAVGSAVAAASQERGNEASADMTGRGGTGPKRRVGAASMDRAGGGTPEKSVSGMPGDLATAPPVLGPEVPQYFVRAGAGGVTGAGAGARTEAGPVLYRPALFGAAQIRYADGKSALDVQRDVAFLAAITSDPIPVSWENAAATPLSSSDLDRVPPDEARFAPLPGPASRAASYTGWTRELGAWLQRSQSLQLMKSPGTGELSWPDESERDFRVRLQQKTREQRDDQTDRLRKKYASKIASLEDRIRRAEQAVTRESEQATQAKLQTAISVGATLLGSLFGRRSIGAGTIGRATTAARGVGRSMREAGDVGRARETVETLRSQLADLEAQVQSETEALGARIDPLTEPLDRVTLRPAKKDVSIRLVALAWTT